MSHIHAFFMHMYLQFFVFLYIVLLVLFLLSLSLSLFLPISLFLALVYSMAPNANPLHPRTLFILGHPLLLLTLHLLTYDLVMIKPERTFQRTFLNEAFIQNTKSFYRIFPILTYPLSSIVGVGGHYVTSQSLVPL